MEEHDTIWRSVSIDSLRIERIGTLESLDMLYRRGFEPFVEVVGPCGVRLLLNGEKFSAGCGPGDLKERGSESRSYL